MLDPYNPHNPRVKAFVSAVEEQIENARNTLERPGKDPSEYDVARGKIKALRWVVTTLATKEDTVDA